MRKLFVLIIASIVLFSFTGAFAQTPTPDADLNKDGTVDEGDLLLLLDQWHVGERYTPTPTETPFTPTRTVTNTPTYTPTSTLTDTPTYTPTYTPTATPTDTATDTPTDTPTDTATPTETPKQQSFLALPSGGTAPLQVRFQYGDPLLESQISEWAWDVNGDSVVDSTEASPTFVYSASGAYTVSLTVETASGETITRVEPDFVVVRDPVETIVESKVVVVDNEACLTYVGKTETELVLDQTCALDTPIEVGTIVVGSGDGGYAREVLAVTAEGTVLTLQTANAPLTAIFEQADMSGLLEFTPEDLQKAGFQIRADGSAWKAFENVQIHAGVTVSGGLEFDPALDWDCRVDLEGVDYFRCAFVGTLSANFQTDIAIQGGLDLWHKEVSLAKVSKWGWYQVGYVPVIIYTEYDIKAGMDAGIEGDLKLKTGYTSATTVRFGAEYDRGDTQPWREITGLSLNSERYGPEFDFGAGGYAKVYLKAEGKIRVYGVQGPSASVETYVRGDLQVVPSPELKLTAGIDAEVGFALVDMSCLGVDFGIGFTGRFNGPVYVLGRWPLAAQTEKPAYPAFTASRIAGVAPLTVDFTDLSNPGDGTITSWHWDFGDGHLTTSQSPTHVYQNPGAFRAKLRVEGTSGSVDWAASELITAQTPGTPPEIVSFSINNGDPSTSSRLVTLNCTVTGNPTHYMASESNTFAGAAWIVGNPRAPFVLSSGDGTKRVYFKTKNASGESSAVSDTIELKQGSVGEEITIDLPSLPVGAKPLVMVRIPAGSFQMGSNDDSSWSWCYPCEQPVHDVNIANDFFIGKYEITQAQWKAVMNSSPSYFTGDNLPVEQVSWNDCQTFITNLNSIAGGGFRLPSEAEWEYSCRAGTTTRFYFGDSTCSPTDCTSCNLDSYAWWCGNSGYTTHVVGGKLPNAWGLYDMSGNVWEWCEDYWHDGYANAPEDGSAWLSPTSIFRVVRGGCWGGYARICRSSYRRCINPGSTYSFYGFRVSRTP